MIKNMQVQLLLLELYLQTSALIFAPIRVCFLFDTFVNTYWIKWIVVFVTIWLIPCLTFTLMAIVFFYEPAVCIFMAKGG